MRIIHTADWHLGDRLGRIDRTEDLRRAVERIGALCRRERADVLLVAGDLFSELARPDNLRETIQHWQKVFQEFLTGGGTIITITGNHDNENFCQTLTHAMSLAAPTIGGIGNLVPPGRLYLAAEPSLLRLADREGYEVQFLLMPYPTPTRYLRDEESRKFASPEEKNRKLEIAFRETMRTMQTHENNRSHLPTILSAHVSVTGANMGHTLFRMTEVEDIQLTSEDIAGGFCYVALGHIHKAQALGGLSHVRYSGSIEKMDLGEKADNKSCVLFVVDADGLVGEPEVIPLPSTNVYEVNVRNPTAEMADIAERYADAKNDLVNLIVEWTAGTDDLEKTLRDLEKIFPSGYGRKLRETSELDDPLVREPDAPNRGFEETVREYIDRELINHTDEERGAILLKLGELLGAKVDL